MKPAVLVKIGGLVVLYEKVPCCFGPFFLKTVHIITKPLMPNVLAYITTMLLNWLNYVELAQALTRFKTCQW